MELNARKSLNAQDRELINMQLQKYRDHNTAEDGGGADIAELIKMIRNQDCPDDIFYNAKIDGVRIANPMTGGRKVQLRANKHEL